MDSSDQLPIDMVEQLLKFTPSAEERVLLDEHSEDIDSLARADRFLYEISKWVGTVQRFARRSLIDFFINQDPSLRAAFEKPSLQEEIQRHIERLTSSYRERNGSIAWSRPQQEIAQASGTRFGAR